MKNCKIYVVIGTRAQLIKMASLMSLMQKEGLEYEFIYTAQLVGFWGNTTNQCICCNVYLYGHVIIHFVCYVV